MIKHCLIIIIINFFQIINAQQEQNFTIRPVNTNVVLGETAILKCAVTAKHGDVQWTHDGTALGYDRQVPGKPTYSVIWFDNEEQEYHLKIVNVRHEDEGVYACQVAPIGDWDTKLEEKVRLTVLEAPSHKPEILFNFETKHDNDVIYVRDSSIYTSKFQCRLGKSKPVGQIRWFLNGTLLTNTTANITNDFQMNGIYTMVTSRLELKSNVIFNNSLFHFIKCQAYHLAYGLNVEVANLTSVLRLVITCKSISF
jgi:hypothetical protein